MRRTLRYNKQAPMTYGRFIFEASHKGAMARVGSSMPRRSSARTMMDGPVTILGISRYQLVRGAPKSPRRRYRRGMPRPTVTPASNAYASRRITRPRYEVPRRWRREAGASAMAFEATHLVFSPRALARDESISSRRSLALGKWK